MDKKSKREPVRDTGSIYSDSTISIKNIEFPAKIAEFAAKKPSHSKFEPKSPRNVEISIGQIKAPNFKKKMICETELGSVKKLCQNVSIKPTFKTDNYKVCRQDEPLTKLLYRNITRKEFCIEKILSSSSTSTIAAELHRRKKEDEEKLKLKKAAAALKPNDIISTTRTDSSPSDTREAYKLLHQRIPLPCPESEAGDLRHKFVGKCTNKDMIREKKQPYDKLKQVRFTRTENAQGLTCLINPNYKPKKLSKLAEEAYIKENVKLADNVDTSSEEENFIVEDKVCVEIDLDNPFNLDFHGLDHKNTLKTDEQDFENVREYRKIKRYAHRIKRKREIEAQCKEEDEIKKFSVPVYFDTNIRYDSNGEAIEVSPRNQLPLSDSSQSGRIGKLYRTEKKQVNRFIIQKEEEQRDGRYRNLVASVKNRDEAIEKMRKRAAEEIEKNKILLMAEKTFQGLFIEKSPTVEQLKKIAPPQEKKRIYPHTLKEVNQVRHKMKKTKFVAHERGKLREQFLNELGIAKHIDEAHLSISDLSQSQTTITEQSSNDDDNLNVGQKSDKYFLRGFHFRLGNEIRGKYSMTDKPPEMRLNKKGCMTRNEWIDALVPQSQKEIIYRRNPPDVLKIQDLNDQKLALFPKKPFPISSKIVGPIREEISKPFGNQYKVFVSKVVKIKKPKTLKVRKFNLTNFIFGDEKTRMNESIDSTHFGRAHHGFGNLTSYIRSKSRIKDAIRRQKRYQRMRYLGIPKILKSEKKSAALCENPSDSEDSNWIPEQYKPISKIDIEKVSTVEMAKSSCTPYPKNVVTEFGYMPAPKFRETTIRRDPNKPRDFAQGVSETAILEVEHTLVPYLKAPPDDKNLPNRLDEPKKDFMSFLNTRHHYDHWEPTQHKDLRVLYKPKYPEPADAAKDVRRDDHVAQVKVKKTFAGAKPSNIHTRDVDFSLPLFKNSELITSTSIKKKGAAMKEYKDVMKTIEYPNIQEEYHSRPRPLPEYPGREEFIQLIKDLNAEIKRQEKARGKAGAEDELKEKMENLIVKDEFMNQLQDELKSIKSCLSSLDSSICTNFTNDSGSFLLAADKKVPMDYIRKSLVPFEEINRTRVKAVPIPQDEIDTNPYKTVPFAGQAKEQLIKPEDKFHTFVSRIRNDIRSRLQIPTVDMSKKKLGITNCKKYKPNVATDLDEIYIEELHNRPPVKIFRRKTSANLIKEAQRKVYVCWCIQQKLIEQKSAEEKQFIYYNNVLKMKNLFNELFLKWQKSHYDNLKKVECKIEPYYTKTDQLRRDVQEFDKVLTSVTMNIVYIENTLMKLTILQNFHYLLMSEEWRQENDWIHKDENEILENFCESIKKRPFANVRVRDRDDAWAIKEFYEIDFVNCKYPIYICFPDAVSFNLALDDLKSKTFVCLLELHFILWLHTNLQHEYNQVLIWAESCNLQRDKFLETKGVKKTFMKKRGTLLQNETEVLINEPLAESVASMNLRRIKAFGEVLYEKLVPWSIRQSVKEDIDIKDKVALISESLLDLLVQIDEIPQHMRETTTAQYRKRLKYDTLLSIKAVEVETRIATSMNTVQRLLNPLKLKSRKEIMAKYGRIKLKRRRITEPPPEEPIPDKIKFFYKAFHDAADVGEITREDQYEIEKNLSGIEEESITFHFDHFLRINDYEPNYNFKTQIEITDGAEENYMKYKDLIPYVKQQVAAWEEMRKLQIKKHIEENPNLYTDIKT